jgi:hypothetical protein
VSIADDLIDRARNCDIRAVAEQYGARLKKVAAVEFAGPCPICGGRDRFSINTRKQVWNCRHCGGDGKGGDAIALAQHLGGLPFRKAIEELAGGRWEPKSATPPAKPAPAKGNPDYERHQHEVARWLWGQRRPLAGTIGETYLRKARGVGGPLPPTLGFLRAHKEHPPALICAFVLALEEIEPGVLAKPRDVQSVQLIALKPDGSGKAEVEVMKRAIGAHKGLPIVVSPPNDLLGLGIHEGVEDALSACEATGLGCWASGGAGFLPDLAAAVPGHIECVTIIGHRDEAGRNGARELALRLTDKGVNVLLEKGPGDG